MNIWGQLQNRKLIMKMNQGVERRKKYIRRMFWHLSDDFKLAIWVVAVVALGPMVWIVLDKILEVGRP